MEETKEVQQAVPLEEAIDNEKSDESVVPVTVPLEDAKGTVREEPIPEAFSLPKKLDKVEAEIKDIFKYINMLRGFILSPIEMTKEINNRKDNVFCGKLANVISAMSSEISKDQAVDIFKNDIKRQVEKRLKHLSKSYLDLEDIFEGISQPLKDITGTIEKTSNIPMITDRAKRLTENELTIDYAVKRLSGALPIPLVNGVERFTPFTFIVMIKGFLDELITEFDLRPIEESFIFYRDQISYFKDTVRYQEHIKSFTKGDEKRTVIEDYTELNMDMFLNEVVSSWIKGNSEKYPDTDNKSDDKLALSFLKEVCDQLNDKKNKLVDNIEKLCGVMEEYCETESPLKDYLEKLEEKAFIPLVDSKITIEEFDTNKDIYSVAIYNIYLADREFIVAINNACIEQYIKANLFMLVENMLHKVTSDLALIKGRSTTNPKLDGVENE